MRLSYDLNPGKPPCPVLGLIVLGVDETVEHDFRRLLTPDAARLFHARLRSDPNLNSATLASMADRLTAAAALLPGNAGLDVIGYACTSGATVLGERTVGELIGQAHPGVPVTNPLTALKAACRALGVDRLGLVSPYVPEVSDVLRRHLEDSGITVMAFGSFDQEQERLVARISPRSITEGLHRIGEHRDCEAVFASCTNLRAVDVIGDVERSLGKPVLASNQVLAWHMLRLAGDTAPWPAGGMLGDCLSHDALTGPPGAVPAK